MPIIRQDVIDYIATLDTDEYEDLLTEARQIGSVGEILSKVLNGDTDEAVADGTATPLNAVDNLAASLFGVVGSSGNLPDFL